MLSQLLLELFSPKSTMRSSENTSTTTEKVQWDPTAPHESWLAKDLDVLASWSHFMFYTFLNHERRQRYMWLDTWSSVTLRSGPEWALPWGGSLSSGVTFPPHECTRDWLPGIQHLRQNNAAGFIVTVLFFPQQSSRKKGPSPWPNAHQ